MCRQFIQTRTRVKDSAISHLVPKLTLSDIKCNTPGDRALNLIFIRPDRKIEAYATKRIPFKNRKDNIDGTRGSKYWHKGEEM